MPTLLQEELSRRCSEQEEALQCAEKRLSESDSKGHQLQEQLDTTNRNAEQLVRLYLFLGARDMQTPQFCSLTTSESAGGILPGSTKKVGGREKSQESIGAMAEGRIEVQGVLSTL